MFIWNMKVQAFGRIRRSTIYGCASDQPRQGQGREPKFSPAQTSMPPLRHHAKPTARLATHQPRWGDYNGRFSQMTSNKEYTKNYFGSPYPARSRHPSSSIGPKSTPTGSFSRVRYSRHQSHVAAIVSRRVPAGATCLRRAVP
jgi:hypothetical protein